jgi:hypothetical protein
MKRVPLFIAAFVFVAVAVVHVLRIYYDVPVVISGQEIPHWASAVATLVFGGLGLYMLKSMCCKKCGS